MHHRRLTLIKVTLRVPAVEVDAKTIQLNANLIQNGVIGEGPEMLQPLGFGLVRPNVTLCGGDLLGNLLDIVAPVVVFRPRHAAFHRGSARGGGREWVLR